ncbi:MAG: threonylcarbamoyl-AMP synthase [Bacteroidales bacterium]|nr:threonylcarbamoyl-AMP synthase [Bacteroidales bacterium]
MKVFRMYESSINQRYIDEIVEALRQGAVIVYPTDSYYAIGCDALNNRAVERVCKIKDINPARQRLSMVCCGISQASEYTRIDNEAFRIMRANLPGPFTFVLPASPRLAKAFKGRKEAGVRVPANEIARRIAAELGNPILSTSAIWDDAEPEQLALPEEVKMHFENQTDIFIDAGDASGRQTAVVDLTDSSEPVMLREGTADLTI